MLNNEQANAIEPAKRVMLILFFGLVIGVVVFGSVALIVRLGKEEPLYNMDFGFMAIIGVAFAALVQLPSIIVPMFVQKASVKEVATKFADNLGDAKAAMQLFGGLQTSMIIGLALLEGAAFFNIVAFLIDGSAFNMLAVAALVACMFIRIPLPGRVEDKIVSMLDDAKHV